MLSSASFITIFDGSVCHAFLTSHYRLLGRHPLLRCIQDSRPAEALHVMHEHLQKLRQDCWREEFDRIALISNKEQLGRHVIHSSFVCS